VIHFAVAHSVLLYCLQHKLVSEVLKLCVLHLNSTNSMVRNKFSHILSLLPWYIVVMRLGDASHTVEVKVCMLMALYTLYEF
jgi:hypothetical protein